jgi:small conductance mechanosensitive channel
MGAVGVRLQPGALRQWIVGYGARQLHMFDWEHLPSWVRVYSLKLAGAVLILFLGWMATRLLIGPLRRVLARSRLDLSLASFLVNSVRTAILLFVLIAVLQQFGLETTSLLTLLGTAGLAVALSLQGSLANFASGLMILAFRTVRIGDFIEVGDVRGRVSEMLPFHIVVETFDNQRITVPNTLLTTGPVRNNSYLPARCVQWTLPIGTSDDLNAVKTALLSCLQADGRIHKEPPPRIYVQEWATDKRTLAVTVWTATADYLAVQQELLEELGKSVEAAHSSGRDD